MLPQVIRNVGGGEMASSKCEKPLFANKIVKYKLALLGLNFVPLITGRDIFMDFSREKLSEVPHNFHSLPPPFSSSSSSPTSYHPTFSPSLQVEETPREGGDWGGSRSGTRRRQKHQMWRRRRRIRQSRKKALFSVLPPS